MREGAWSAEPDRGEARRPATGRQPPVIDIERPVADLQDQRRAGRGAVRHQPQGRPRRVRLADRAVRLRQDHAPARHRRSRDSRPAARSPSTASRPRRRARKRAYGYVFQAPALYPWRTIARNVALPLEIMGLAEAERDARVAKPTSSSSTSPASSGNIPGSCPAACSSAPRSPARLSFEPDLLLMDEPFGALDEIVRDHLNEQLLQLWAKTDKTVVFVTHSIPEAVFLSTRIVVMSPRPGQDPRRHRLDAAARAHARHPRDAGVPEDRPPRPRRACAPGTAMRTEARRGPPALARGGHARTR